jgi:phosphoribosylglycinamide formyltransferase 2
VARRRPATDVPLRDRIGTPLVGNAPRLLLLGSGELGREIAVEAMRLGAEVIAVDRYPNAPAMQVAHRHHVLAMTDAAGLRAIVEREAPDLIVPEIEQIATDELVRLEHDGWTVIPRAEATRTTMDRERIRRLAADEARVPTSRFAVADSPAEARTVAAGIGFPCVFKSITSSSGHGMTVVREAGGVDAAYRSATREGRVENRRAMVEEFIPFDLEVTVLTLRHRTPRGGLATTVLAPIGHARPGTLYHESWQPAELAATVVDRLGEVARAVTDRLGGVGIFGVECFVRGPSVYFSEVSPRPHDTGLVTLGSQWNSEFALHARAILGLPYVGPEPTTPAAAHVILAPSAGWAPSFGGLPGALGTPEVRLFLFGKPEAYPDRRLGVAVARGASVGEARRRAEAAAHAVERTIELTFPERTEGAGH